MNLGLDGKVALVTAASRGLGFATALELAREGARVALCSRDAQRAAEAADDIAGRSGGEVRGYAADVASADDLDRLFAAVDRDFGGLDVLVSNAGGPPAGTFRSLDEAKWDHAYRLTLLSVVRSVSLALPRFAATGGGAILVITSSSVKRPIPGLVLSNAFRPAVQGLCKTLASELAGSGVRVNCLAPGRFATERVDELDRATAEREGIPFAEVRRRAEAGIPLGRLGSTDELGRVAAFLCSPAASYLTGTSVLVDGGAVRCT